MRIIVIIGIVLLVAGCVPPSQTQVRMERDLEQMKRRLAQLEVRKVDAAQTEVTDGTALQRQVAELQAGLDNMRLEFHSVNGLIDDLGRQHRDLGEEMRLVQDDLNLQIDSLTSRIENLETDPQPTRAEPVAVPQLQPQQPAAPELTPEQRYEQALRLILDGVDFAGGREQMESFARDFPSHDLYVNAIYWVGEALYGERKYELSILQFQDVISGHPRHSKAPDALYKQALAFSALNDSQNARATMRKLLDTYPGTEQARAAERFLQN